MDKINNLIKNLTIEEKAELLSGHNSWLTYEVKRLNIPNTYWTIS